VSTVAPGSPESRAAHGAKGAGHWWAQRVRTVALIPLAVWFAVALCRLPAFDYPAVSAWMAGRWTAVLLLLLVVNVAWHSVVGVQEVIEDYVHGPRIKPAALIAVKLAHFAVAAVGVYAVLRVAFGAAA
jgi:succinate dehydrogenase / fumarate reductase membrane anchor subunit